MAVPYPNDRQRSGNGQERDFRIGIASKVILESIDENLEWDALLERTASRLRLSLEVASERTRVRDAFLAAELDLEWTNQVVYTVEGTFRRPLAAGDPEAVAEADLREVADAVLGLGWPGSGHKPSRTIYECFVELGGRYRHCDVYWAMHKHLKDFKLRVVRAHWMLQDDLSAMLADPSLTQHERHEIERELEEDLVRRYVAWLGRPVKKRRFANGREADLFDPSRGLLIEAKVYHRDDVLVAHGMGQAMYYRTLDRLPIDTRIAVLIPGAPSDAVVRLLDIYDVGLIHPQGDAFVEVLRG
ncbi:hypothetical protein BJ980_002346 [Nocardioides daedukensis]|uniref:Uncharacterized protein n=1 Tax=Nocardioides daedukensis TaxID=634462 RepID=A0A7Y9S3H3_9ACTN|nr:hypothetical protein [Nocardioides daedukensis]NYG59423.1 hypothetical protein [Nocardioides daedukensis]